MKIYKLKDGFFESIPSAIKLADGRTLQDYLDEGGGVRNFTSRLPQVRITSSNLRINGDEIIGLTIAKNEVEAIVEYTSKDLCFTESCVIAYQGNSTLQNPKKGFSIDFENKHRFNNWLEFDGYHLKAYYIDWTHSRDLVSNRLLEQVYNSREKIRPYLYHNDFEEAYKSMEVGAMCHIDGFPCELYINGVYWGLYSLNLKKTNDNYFLNKKNKNHIMFEPDNNASITSSGWNWRNIEIRCPKSVVTNIDGSKYDGDNPQEIADGDVKTSITDFISWVSSISTSMTKEQIEARFNSEVFIDWYLFCWFIDNIDIVGKNTLYTTWDGNYWSLLIYDMDNTYGMYAWATGDAQHQPNYDTFVHKANNLAPWIPKLASIFAADIRERYAELRRLGIFDLNNIKALFNEFTKSVGADAYAKDLARWSYPSYGQSSANFVFTTQKLFDWVKGRIVFLDNKFGYSE